MTGRHSIRVPGYLQHILGAIDRIAGYTAGMENADALEKNWMAQDAVIRQ